MGTLPPPPAGGKFVEVRLLFDPDTGEFRLTAPPGALMLALAILDLGRDQILKKIFATPRAVVPARFVPRIS